MEKDREKWNKKYGENNYASQVSEHLKKFYALARVGKALDIAAGIGVNSLFLADKGFTVDALDISDYALEKLKQKNSLIHTIETDLDSYVIEQEKYDLIVNIKFLHRRLFPYIKEGLKKEGILIFETYLETEDINLQRYFNRDYLLRKNELLHSFLSLRILFYSEEKTEFLPGETIYKATLVGQKQ